MKKISLLIVMVLIGCQLVSCNKGNQSVVNNNGVVNFVTGDVTLTTDGKVVSVNVGDVITQGMIVKTGVKAIVEINFSGSNIRIKEKSSVTMKELVKNIKDNKESSELYVDNGEVLFKVTKKLTDGEKFRVNTPTSVAGVRGTEFSVVENEGKSIIACTEGRVAVKEASMDDASFVMVDAGKKAIVEQGQSVVVKNIYEGVNSKEKGSAKKEEIKKPEMIRSEAVKGDIEVKK